jgi:hypothetical protein
MVFGFADSEAVGGVAEGGGGGGGGGSFRAAHALRNMMLPSANTKVVHLVVVVVACFT